MADVLKKVPVREQEPKVRATNFEEVCYGYNKEEAMEEALKDSKIIVADPLYRPIAQRTALFMNFHMWHFQEEYIYKDKDSDSEVLGYL